VQTTTSTSNSPLSIVLFILLLAPKYVSRFQRPSLFGTQLALNHEAFSKAKDPAGIADPVLFREGFNAIAALMDWNAAVATEDYEVFILIVTIVANGTLGILLSH
jgi:hypothetical protein